MKTHVSCVVLAVLLFAVAPQALCQCDVTISPKAALVASGGTITFTATTSGDNCEVPSYTWQVSSPIGSTINENRVYRAGTMDPGTTATDVVTVIDAANGGITDFAVVQVYAPACALGVFPSHTTVESEASVQFEAVSTGEGCSSPDYQWSISSSIGSTIDQTGNYTAGLNETGWYAWDQITVTDAANDNLTAGASVAVQPTRATFAVAIQKNRRHDVDTFLFGPDNEFTIGSLSGDGTGTYTTYGPFVFSADYRGLDRRGAFDYRLAGIFVLNDTFIVGVGVYKHPLVPRNFSFVGMNASAFPLDIH